VASGWDALYSNTTGDANTGIGSGALYFNSTGLGNTASGYNALYFNSTGVGNTASGYNALERNTTGSDNTASGVDALHSNTVGKQSTAVGVKALFSGTTGNNNLAVGYNALSALTGASSGNIALGSNAGYLTKTGNSNIYIGSYGISASETNVTRIGRTQTRVFIKGISGVPLSGAPVVINSAGQLGVASSSARYKRDIKPLADMTEKLAQLRPVSFSYKTEPDATHYGLIAEEVDKVMPELVVQDEQGRPDAVQYLELIPLLLEERQEMQAELTRQQSELERERALIEQQAEALTVLRRTLDTRLSALEQSNGEDVASLK
jgi:hypothetical protein